ncbi:MAG: hypothetical protein EA381_08775 [Planctomycetaceae bacterium]|nr:MAG: hypothetical protein EA381_08775 [Planctomycetaceae bacterium]
MLAVDIASRFIHVLTAITLVGGSLFTLLVLLPASTRLEDQARGDLMVGIRDRWRRVVHGGIALFLLSGFYNYFRAMPLHRGDGLYHGLLGTKMLLALAVFALASLLVGRSRLATKMAAQRERWLGVMVLLAIAIVAISAVVKVRG